MKDTPCVHSPNLEGRLTSNDWTLEGRAFSKDGTFEGRVPRP